MKKILLAMSMALVLSACSSETVKNKAVEQITTKTTEVGTNTTEKTSNTSSETTKSITTSETTSKETTTTKAAKTEDAINIDAENIKKIFNLFNGAGKSVEKLVSLTGTKHHIEGSEYQTSAVSTLTQVTDAYNAIQSETFTKEKILEEISKNVVLEKVDDKFNDEDIRKIMARDPENVVIYFEGDGKLYLGMKKIFHGGAGTLAPTSEWVVKGQDIYVPVQSFTKEKLFNLVYKKNNKGTSQYKYYIEKQDK